MKFAVITGKVPLQPGAYLCVDKWDDYHFGTQFQLSIVDPQLARHDIGSVKIAFRGMAPYTTTRSKLPEPFSQLENGWFSLGQDVSYFERLTDLGDATRESVLTSFGT